MVRPGAAWTREQLAMDSVELAPRLLGSHLLSRVDGATVELRLTEVEAYAGARDPASHAYRGRTARNVTMFGPAGTLYVYFIYGMHWCANLVCGPEGEASAVLLRAGEVLRGHDAARDRRPAARTDRDLARGPARLASALALGRAHDGLDLLAADSPVSLCAGTAPVPERIRTGPRTGVSGAGATTPWRFWIDGESSVSPYRPAVRRTRG